MAHWSLARIVPAPTVGNVVNPVPILHDKLVPLAGEVVKSSRPPGLAAVQSTDYPPFTLYLHDVGITVPSRKRAHYGILAHPPLWAQFPAKA